MTIFRIFSDPGRAEACIAGWVDLYGDEYSVCLTFCVRDGLSPVQKKGGL